MQDYGGVYADARLDAWLSALGRGLAAQSGRRDIAFSFTILDSGAVNAFSTPEGAIFVTRGLLALANSDAEIAGALGHEIGHVVAGDRAEGGRLTRMRDRLAGLLAGLADWTGLDTVVNDKRFSQAQEFDADAYAIRIEAAAGYDPRALAAFLATLDHAAAPTEDEAAAPTRGYADTHPLTSDRIARANGLAAPYPTGQRIGRETYLRAIDGMIYGDSADQGYVRGGVFIHPRAGFRFDIPRGFSIRNTPLAVIASRPDGAALVLTSAVPGIAATPYDYLTETWTTGLSLSSEAAVSINGRPAAVATARAAGNRGPLDVSLAVIGWSPSLVYRWVSSAPLADVSIAASVLSSALAGFRRVTQDELARLQPLRLRVLTAKPGDTVANLAGQMAIENNPEDLLRILNGWLPDERIRAGQQFKVVQ
jgi:predicted Zn-dependent protease